MGFIKRLIDALQRRSNKSNKDYHSLFSAAEAGDAKAVTVLISKGADVNEAQWDGRTPLQEAAARSHTSCVRVLLDKGADINANSWVGTALHCAIKTGDTELANLLLQRGADPNIVSHTTGKRFGGSPPLAVAAGRGDLAAVELLLEHGADPTITSGTTGLLPLDVTDDHAIKDRLGRAAEDCGGQEQPGTRAASATHNEDGTLLSDAVPEKLADETDALIRLLSELPVLNAEECREFRGWADYNDQSIEELGGTAQAVDWIVTETANLVREVQRQRPEITKIRISFRDAQFMRGLLAVTLHRTFSSVPPGFPFKAVYGPGTDTKTVFYICRLSEDGYAARYMSPAEAACE